MGLSVKHFNEIPEKKLIGLAAAICMALSVGHFIGAIS